MLAWSQVSTCDGMMTQGEYMEGQAKKVSFGKKSGLTASTPFAQHKISY